MRKEQLINENWLFRYHDGTETVFNIPHTWNNIDGQDGGDDYYRGTCVYEKDFTAPAFGEDERLYIEFAGVNASAKVIINGKTVITHDGGYSTFRADITNYVTTENHMVVEVDNSKNDRVYPQKADFTFYGGIYRDVKLIVVNQYHFDMDYFGGKGLAVCPEVGGEDAAVWVRTWHNATNGVVSIVLKDAEGRVVGTGDDTDETIIIEKAHFWHGIEDPYLYTCEATLLVNEQEVDFVSCRFGVRSFRVDAQKGFILNGKEYPLRGVCRHQDWKGIGNAITKEHHDIDMAMIREVGANTIRLAHYQHDQYFYDLCDEYGMVVWAEIPYISEHMPAGRENTISQMKELIVQCYNHPSICVWGISNEITISTKKRADMLDNHQVLNDLIHEMDPSRPTTLACYAMCAPFDPVGHLSDIVSWNLYLGWYTPFMWLNNLWVDYFHKRYPNRCLGYSEYGCECMPNLHSSHPRRGDQSEEYQCKYNEYMLNFFDKRPFMWATHLWNMFDFAADARNQGGEPGMNHKGLVTFDRKTKKDSFYVYKAWWSKEPFVYITGRRYVDRAEKKTTVKVYSNCPEVTLYLNGEKFATQKGNKVFRFRIPLKGEVQIKAVSGEHSDEITIRHAKNSNPLYKLGKKIAGGGNWT
ncbi:MAG: glycoside hydrolase family 2 protein [Clostridia bacterium]|nr:glycoside hydrolase family 2 protein [Clostridia bacterium]